MSDKGLVLITGGSRGIGAECARLLAADGFAVAINYRIDDKAAAAVVSQINENGGNGMSIQADVADDEQIQNMFAELEGHPKPLVGVVNSAGIEMGSRSVVDMDAASLERLFRVNVLGTMSCCREAVRKMSTRFSGTGGSIVNISSMAATIGGRAGSADYAASKAAVDAFTVGLAKEVGAEGIRVNAVRPGMTMTDMTEAFLSDPEVISNIADTIPMNRVATANEIAAPVAWLFSENASFISGACLDASGGGYIVGKQLSDS